MNTAKIDDVSCQKTKLMLRMISNSSHLTQEINFRMKRELSLSLAKYEALTAIENSSNGEITMGNLSHKLFVSNANVTGMTERLKNDGLVEKEAYPPDRRIYSVSLTDKGREMLERATERHGVWIKELMASIDIDEVSFMNNVLDKIDHHVECFNSENQGKITP